MAILTIKEFVLFYSFFEEYLKLYKDNKNKGNKVEAGVVALAIVFHHLVLENLIVYFIRSMINNTCYNNYRLRGLWDLMIARQNFRSKIKFLENLFSYNLPSEFKELKSHLLTSNDKRNFIVHGAEIHIMKSDDGLYGESKLYKLIDNFNFEKDYKELIGFIEKFLDIMHYVSRTDLRPKYDWDKSVEDVRNKFRSVANRYVN